MEFNPIFYIDFYKAGHVSQYPEDVTKVISNWTPRSTRVKGQTEIVHFGLQYLITEYLQRQFQRNFFDQPIGNILKEYKNVISTCLGQSNPKTDHIEALHEMGFLPLDIYSIPEGFSTPLGVPSLVITNTVDHAFWLPNYLETLLSMSLWKSSTSATTAKRLRKIGEKWARKWGTQSALDFVDWQFHDFSMRGMSGMEDAILSGMGHLTSFRGTDTVPAILAACEFYGADLSCGGSVPATEHSVMCAGGMEDEQETFRRLIEDIYPSGIVSIVSDTWDLWRVLTDYIPALKDRILARDGKVVIRPDSGDPVKIMCGDKESPNREAYQGVLALLENALGSKNGLINGAGAIYGDSINEERAEAILSSCVNDLRLSPSNMVFGVGSYTYEWVTRDTNGYAMKATAVCRNGKIVPIFKSPVTDDPKNPKKSLCGIPVVYRLEESTEEKPYYFVWAEDTTLNHLDNCAFQKVFHNGELVVNETFDSIRKRVRT